jgi:hypothetical protein
VYAEPFFYKLDFSSKSFSMVSRYDTPNGIFNLSKITCRDDIPVTLKRGTIYDLCTLIKLSGCNLICKSEIDSLISTGFSLLKIRV